MRIEPLSGGLPPAAALIREYGMLPPGATVLCAVSGGADSMCLLHYLACRDGLTVHAAHFNHRLRGAESDRDEAFVRDWCAARGIPFHAGSGDVAAEAKRLGQGLEETARALRYGFLSQLALRLGADRVATAHNAGDNVETVLMHLLRGSGLSGLTGIAPVRRQYVRPLLTTSRAEIEAYLAENRVPHVEDSTNRDEAFTRNRIRHRLIPLLEELAPGFSARMTEAIPRLRADDGFLDSLAQPLSQQARRQGDDLLLPAAVLSRSPGPVAARAARLLLARAAPEGYDCSAAHIEALLSLARSENPSGTRHLPHGLTARREYGTLILTRAAPPAPLAPFSPAEGTNPVPGAPWALVVEGAPWPGLTVRPRQTGDELTLPGGHRRSLKKLFIDRKIPRLERETIPVAADEAGVVAVAGFGPNLAHPRHRRVAFIKLEQEDDEND